MSTQQTKPVETDYNNHNVIAHTFRPSRFTQYVHPEVEGNLVTPHIDDTRKEGALFVGRVNAALGHQYFEASFHVTPFHELTQQAFEEGRLETIKLLFTVSWTYSPHGIDGLLVRAVYPNQTGMGVAGGWFSPQRRLHIGTMDGYDVLPEANVHQELPYAFEFNAERNVTLAASAGSINPHTVLLRVEKRLREYKHRQNPETD